MGGNLRRFLQKTQSIQNKIPIYLACVPHSTLHRARMTVMDFSFELFLFCVCDFSRFVQRKTRMKREAMTCSRLKPLCSYIEVSFIIGAVVQES